MDWAGTSAARMRTAITVASGRPVIRLRATRGKNFLPAGLRRFQRRAEEVALRSRRELCCGASAHQVGRVVATLTGEVVSAQTVSKLTRDLDRAVEKFHQARLRDEWVYLFLDGVSLRVRRPAGRQRVQMLVAYGVRADGSRQLLGFCAVEARARPLGKVYCRISTGAACRAGTWLWL